MNNKSYKSIGESSKETLFLSKQYYWEYILEYFRNCDYVEKQNQIHKNVLITSEMRVNYLNNRAFVLKLLID